MGNLITQSTYDKLVKEHVKYEVDVISGEVKNSEIVLDKDGYVLLKGTWVRLHHLIAYHIFGERIIGKQINHLNGKKEDNSAKNLELCSASENVKHAFDTKLKFAKKGEQASFSKLRTEDVIKIRHRRKKGEVLTSIADDYGMSFQQISRICRGDRWAHIPMDLEIDLDGFDFDEFQEYSRRTMNSDLDDFQTISNMALGVVSESGELADEIKKVLFHGHDLDTEKILSEGGDVLFYLSNLLDSFGVSLRDCAIYNIDKLRKRYPDGFDSARSVNRTE